MCVASENIKVVRHSGIPPPPVESGRWVIVCLHVFRWGKFMYVCHAVVVAVVVVGCCVFSVVVSLSSEDLTRLGWRFSGLHRCYNTLLVVLCNRCTEQAERAHSM